MRDRKSPQLAFHSQRLQKHQRWIKERGGVGRTSTTGNREIKKLEFLREIMFCSIVRDQVEAYSILN